MDLQKIYLTPEGLEELKAEYQGLTKNKRPAAVTRLARARDFGDLTENSEYQSAKEELTFIDKRIFELEEIFKNSRVVKKIIKPKTAVIGSKVTVKINGDIDKYTIVGSLEAEPESGKISNESPVGKNLLGHTVGEEVEVKTPNAVLHFKIIKIE